MKNNKPRLDQCERISYEQSLCVLQDYPVLLIAPDGMDVSVFSFNALEKAGFEIRTQIIWAKHHFAWGFARYKGQHELIFYAHVNGQTDNWYGDKAQSTLWEEKKPAANKLHPTMKPVGLIERALRNSSQAGDIVVDLFGGSGSTLIACERLNRLPS